MRGGIAVLLFIAGGVAIFYCWWLGLAFIGIGSFTLFEALRGLASRPRVRRENEIVK